MFQQQLLIDQRRLIGRFDSRVTGYNPEPMGNWPQYDPSASPAILRLYRNVQRLIRRALDYRSDLPYEVLSNRVQPGDSACRRGLPAWGDDLGDDAEPPPEGPGRRRLL